MGSEFDDFGDLDREGSSGLDLNYLLAAARRRKWIFAIGFSVTLPFALLPALFVKPVYEAEAKISIEKPPEITTFGGALTSEEAWLERRSPIQTTTAVILSDRVLGRVVDQVPEPEPQPPGPLKRAKLALKSWLGAAPPEEMSPALLRQLRIGGLRAVTRVVDVGGGTILGIKVEDGDAQRAAFLVNAVADAFIEYDRDRRRSAARSASSYLTQKENELRDKIRRQQEAMAEIVKQLGGVPKTASDPERDAKRQDLMADLEEAQLELLAAERRLAELGPQVRQMAQAADSAARQEYYRELRRQLAEAEANLTPEHPTVQRLRSSVAELESQVGTGTVSPNDPLAQQRVAEYERLRTERGVIEARVTRLQRSLDELVGSGEQHSAEAAAYQRLEREVEMDLGMLREIQGRLNSTALSAAKDQALARVLDYAVLPVQSGGSSRKLLILGFGAALGVGMGLAMLRELLDRAEHDSNRAADALGAQILANIPLADPELMKRARAALEYTTPVGEAFRRLRTSLIYSGVGSEMRTIVIASAVAGEGKTTVSTNLAASFSQTGRRVLLIDADMRRPRVNEVVGLPRGPGLSELLRGRVKPPEVIQSPKIYGADVITSGEIPDNPTDLLSSPAMSTLLTQMQAEYDLIIIDAPVLLAVSDALLVAANADGVLIVNKPGSVEKGAFQTMSTELRRVGARMIGMVANQVKTGDTYSYPSYLESPYVSSRRRGWFSWLRRGPAARRGA
jgi:capsular exopolysaccharide synthesis family protein